MNAILKPTAMTTASSAGTNAEWHARRLAATPRGVGVMSDFFIDHAKNAEFWDIEGRRFIDFAGGIAVLNTGHVHPKVQAAIAAEPQAVHVPRERPAAVNVDAGPLVLVETKRDLRNMTLPFEETTQG